MVHILHHLITISDSYVVIDHGDETSQGRSSFHMVFKMAPGGPFWGFLGPPGNHRDANESGDNADKVDGPGHNPLEGALPGQRGCRDPWHSGNVDPWPSPLAMCLPRHCGPGVPYVSPRLGGGAAIAYAWRVLEVHEADYGESVSTDSSSDADEEPEEPAFSGWSDNGCHHVLFTRCRFLSPVMLVPQ